MGTMLESYADLIGKATSLASHGRFIDAAAYFERAKEIKPNSTDAVIGWLMNTLNLGRLRTAGEQAKYYLENGRANVGFMAQMSYIYGVALVGSGQAAQARQFITAAFQAAPYIQEHKIDQTVYLER